MTAAAGIYVVLGLLLYLLQERMVFLASLPTRQLQVTPEAVGWEYDDVSFTTPDGLSLHGWYIHVAEPRGTVLFFHGNAGNISHRLESIADFHALGFNVFIIDYRGYGQSEGKPREEGTYIDAQAAWDYLTGVRGEKPQHIVLFGRSLGGAVAAWLATRTSPAALLVESTFTSAVDMARSLYPVFPARLLTRLDYPAIDYVARARCPVLVVHSRDDEIIPFRMGRALFDAAPEPKAFVEISGDHNAGFYLSRHRYREGLREFFSVHMGSE